MNEEQSEEQERLRREIKSKRNRVNKEFFF